MWILDAFLSAVFAGLTAILAKMGVKKVNSHLATALRTVVVALFAWLMVFIVGSQHDIAAIDRKTWLFLMLSGLATGASWICYFRALQLGNVNQVTPIDKSSTVLTMLLAFIILGEAISLNMVLGMVMILTGTYLMIQKQESGEIKSDASRKGWMLFAVLSAVFASLTAILGKIGISGVESNLGTAVRTMVVLGMAWLIVFAQGTQRQIKGIDRKSWIFLILSGFATGASWLFFYRALQTGEASIVVPIDKLSVLITVGFSYFFLHEKLSKKALLGLVLLTAGTLILLVKF